MKKRFCLILSICAFVLSLSGCGVRRRISEYPRLSGVHNHRSFLVQADYNKTIEEMVAAGHYDGSNARINSKNFSSKRHGVASIKIEFVYFEDLEREGLRPAELLELLAFAAQYPEERWGFPIVAFGSESRDADGLNYFPYMENFRDGRYLLIHPADTWWFPNYRFAAVRK